MQSTKAPHRHLQDWGQSCDTADGGADAPEGEAHHCWKVHTMFLCTPFCVWPSSCAGWGASPYTGWELWMIPVLLLRSTGTNFENSPRISLSPFKGELGSSSESCLVLSVVFLFPVIRQLTFKEQHFWVISLL